MNTRTWIASIGITLAAALPWPAMAATTVAIGKPIELFADPGDFVVVLDTPGSCGSRFFHVQRTNANFRELTALMLTSSTAGRSLRLFVTSCMGERNIVSHAGMF